MTQRLSSEKRRTQIIETTLECLATNPVPELSTRMIARKVGISQPAIFRHFRSRNDLLLAVSRQVLNDIEEMAITVVTARRAPRASLEAWVKAMMDYTRRREGFLKLLFHKASSGHREPYHDVMSQAISMQSALIAELVYVGKRKGVFPAQVDHERAASWLTALIQGLVLQWQTAVDEGEHHQRYDGLLAFWLSGLDQGLPRLTSNRDPVVSKANQLQVIGTLDLREVTQSGGDVIAAVDTYLCMHSDVILIRMITEKNVALLTGILESRDCQVDVVVKSKDLHEILVQPGEGLDIHFFHEEPAPVPLERTMALCVALGVAGRLVVTVPRVPFLLFSYLKNHELDWDVCESVDGSAYLVIWRPA